MKNHWTWIAILALAALACLLYFSPSSDSPWFTPKQSVLTDASQKEEIKKAEMEKPLKAEIEII